MQHQLNEITLKLFRYFDVHFKASQQKLIEQDKHIEGLYKLVDTFIRQSEAISHDKSAEDLRLIRLEQKVVALSRQTRTRRLSQ